MQGEKQKGSEGDHPFLRLPTRKGISKISAGIPFLLSWGPSLLPRHFASALLGLSSHRERCRAAQVPLAVGPFSIRVTIWAPWGLPP